MESDSDLLRVYPISPTVGDLENKKNQVCESSFCSLDDEKEEVSLGEYIRSVIFGGFDGIITTFSIVAGAHGSNSGTIAVVIIGLSGVIADGLSQSMADFLSSKAERNVQRAKKRKEIERIEKNPSDERDQLIGHYKDKGVTSPDAKLMTSIISKNKKAWVDVMMVEKLGFLENEENPIKGALATFISFLVFGLFPLLPYIIALIASIESDWVFYCSFGASAVVLFLLGLLKGWFSGGNLLKNGLETLIIGVFAAIAAYSIGVAFESIATKD